MLNWMIDSPTLFVTSPTVSTPLHRSSQELFANSPVDSVVPRTPSINNNQYCIDQCVPHTPATLSIATSPANNISIPGTPLNHLNATSPSRYSILYFDNQDDNFANAANIDSANATSIDQIVPSTPSNACEPYVHTNRGDHSSHSSSVNRNGHSCVGNPSPSSSTVAQSNILTKHLRSTPRKQLTLRKCDNTFAHTITTHQTLPSKKASATQGSSSSSNTTATLSIPEHSLIPAEKTYTTSGRVATPLNNSPLPQSTNEPAATTSACSPCTLPSDSLATITASTSPVPYVSAVHTREIRHVLRQSAHMGEERPFQGRHEAVPNSTQLQLFDDDDIF